MRAYVIRRLLISIPLVLLMTFVIFAIINLEPQSALDRYILNPNISFQVIEQVKERTGFYDAMPVRYAKWLAGVLFDIRIGRPTRSLISFADPRQFPQQFGVEARCRLMDEPIELSPDAAQWNALASETLRHRLAAVADPLTAFTVEYTAALPADPAPEGDEIAPPALIFTLRGADDKTLQLRRPLTEPGPAIWTIPAIALQEAGLSGHMPVAFEIALSGRARVTLQAVHASLDLYRIIRPARQRPYLSIRFPAADVVLAWRQPGSPHITHRLRRQDWLPKGKPVGVDDEGRSILATESFRSLRVEVGNPDDRPATYALRLLTGPEDAPRPTVRHLRLGARERGFREFPLAELAAEGADLEQVRAIEWAALGPSRLVVYRTELTLAVPLISIGGVPDFGRSHDNIPVLEKLAGRVKNTILLVVASMILTWLIALPAGILAAVRQYRLSDKVISFLTFVGMSLPSFFLAVLVRYLLQEAADPHSPLAFLPDLPDSGRTSIYFDSLSPWGQILDILRHAVAPILVLTLGGLAGLQRVMRGTMLETLRQPYIVTARAKGLSERAVIYKHALRNAITPFVAGFGSILPGLIGGSVFIEMVFNYPGVGQMMYPAVLNRDLNLVMANTLIAALLLVIGNLIADLLLAWVDPRVSYE